MNRPAITVLALGALALAVAFGFGGTARAGPFQIAGAQATYGKIGFSQNKAGYQVRLSTSPLRPGESLGVSKRYSIQIGILGDSASKAAARMWALYE